MKPRAKFGTSGNSPCAAIGLATETEATDQARPSISTWRPTCNAAAAGAGPVSARSKPMTWRPLSSLSQPDSVLPSPASNSACHSFQVPWA